jgi:hypothetical protein
MNQSRKNQRSTVSTAEPDIDDFTPSPAITDGLSTHYVYAAIEEIPKSKSGLIYKDQTGRFSIQSLDGMNYVLILYDYDFNSIHAEAIANRTASEILRAYKKIHTLLISLGLKPKLQRLDNEASKILKAYMHNEDIDFQLAPPGIHRRNTAERRAIRKWKNHFLAGLCTTDPNFPLYLWNKLIDQAIISLNLLHQSQINPRLSAYAQVHGNFDFNRTPPMAPTPGTKCISHVKPDKCKSWDLHGDLGWYIGPVMEHYRCWKVHITKTNAERTTDTNFS